MYKYLLWDIDGTVLDFLAAEKAAIQTLFLKYGFGECSDEMVACYSKINVRYWEMLERNEMTKPQILVGRFREFFERQGIDPTRAEAFNADYQLALGDTIVFCDDSKNLLLKLKEEGYVLAALTNGTREAQTKKLKNSGLDQIFDHVFISEEIGVEKPNIGFFDAAFTKMGLTDKSQAILIGDSLTSDIRGANNAGVDSCWYNPKSKTRDQDVEITYEISDLWEILNILQK